MSQRAERQRRPAVPSPDSPRCSAGHSACRLVPQDSAPQPSSRKPPSTAGWVGRPHPLATSPQRWSPRATVHTHTSSSAREPLEGRAMRGPCQVPRALSDPGTELGLQYCELRGNGVCGEERRGGSRAIWVFMSPT